jgi:predicted mannosyl-3-phosphoglycerate phosphatase (HAD superfamily)
MPRLRTKQKTSIRNISQVEAERLRDELGLQRASVKRDPAIVENGGSLSLPAHVHDHDDISDFDTATDARITNAVGSSVQAYSALLTGVDSAGAQAAISDASGGSTVDTEARAALNDLLAKLRTLGLIAT